MGTARWWLGQVRSSLLDELSLISLLEIQVVLSSRNFYSGTQKRSSGQRGVCGCGLWIIIARVCKINLYMGAGTLVGRDQQRS